MGTLDLENDAAGDEESGLWWRRIRLAILGAVGAFVLGFVVFLAYANIFYGQSPKEALFGVKKSNPDAGKLAYDINTHEFVGVIKSEGYSVRHATQVYYVERAGGALIEIPKNYVEVKSKAPSR